jgi:hypothetical protein
MIEFIHLIPIGTTIFSIIFFYIIFNHYRRGSSPAYLLWWTIGIFCYGLGTFTESWVTLFGWSEGVFKFWYIAGALLGGAPLAQGTVHLLMKSKSANILSAILASVIIIVSVLVILSPINYEAVEPGRLTGSVLGWQWVRLTTPFINIYAFIFLVGGAIYSAWKYARKGENRSRMIGNILIAIGGLLPGIGGSFTKFGYTEVLYVTEFIGLVFIFWGYWVIKQDRSQSVHQNQVVLN